MQRMRCLGFVFMLLAIPGAVSAQDLARQVTEGCGKEIATYCSQVTPGEGRVLACLFAHEDKLSGRCGFALYDASARLERAVNALGFVAHECRQDIQTKCASVAAGEGRILQCLQGAGDKLAQGCSQALKDTGLR